MDYKALSLEEVTKKLAEGDINNIWYADMNLAIGDKNNVFTALRPLLQARTEDLLEPAVVFFEIKEKAKEIDITKRI